MAEADYLTQLTDKGAPPSAGTSLESAIGSMGGQSMDTKMYQKGLGTIEKGLEENIKKRNEIPSATPPTLEPEPQFKPTDPWQTFGSAGMFLAAFGSLLTKKPLTNALNSGAEVLRARNEADYSAYKQAFDKWKVNTDNAWKMADWNRNNLKDLHEKYKDNHADLVAEMDVWSKATQDPTLEHMVKATDIKQHLLAIEENTDKLNKSREEQQLLHDKTTDIVDDWKTQNNITDDKLVPKKVFTDAAIQAETAMASAKKGTTSGAEYGVKYESWKEKPSSIKDADEYANGSPIANFMRARGKDSGEQLQMIKDLAAERHPDYERDQAVQDYNAANKAISAFGTGKQGDIVKSLNVAYSHINLVSDLAKALDNGDVKSINALSQDYEEQFGNPAPTNFDAAKRILADEITKAVIGSAGALTDREGTADTVSRANSYEQTEQGLDTFKGLMRGQLSGLGRQYEQATKRKDFDRLLSEDVKNDLKKYRSEGKGTADKPFTLPVNGKYIKDKYYINDDGQVGKYTGEKNGQHVFE